MNRLLRNLRWVMLSALMCQTIDARGEGAGAAGSSSGATVLGGDELRFRRLLVPADQIETWPRGGGRLIPMKSEEFERRIRNAALTTDAPRARAELVDASYEASLDARGDLSGTGAWTIKHTGQGRAFIDIGSMNLALGQPHWSDTEGKERALLGANARQETKLAVERSGDLAFSWSARATGNDDDGPRFELKLVPSPSSRLLLWLPKELTPSVVGGAVVNSAESDGSRRRWIIQATGSAQIALQLEKRANEIERRSPLVWRPKLDYELSPRGLQLTAEWKIDVLERSIRQLTVDLDPRLVLLGVQQGNKSAAWSADENSPSDAQRIIVELPEGISGTGNSLRLAAAAPLVVDKAWRLPRLQPVDATWQDGSIMLRIDSNLSLQQLDTIECRQLKRELIGMAKPVGAARPFEGFALQPLSATAEIDVVMTQRKSKFHSASVTSIDLSGTEVNGRFEADITAIEGERFTVEGLISSDWVIDAVSTVPSGLVADWNRERTASQSSRLVVRLSKTVNRHSPVRLIVSGQRRRAPLGDTLTLDDLRLLTLEEIAPQRHLMVVRTSGPYRLDVQPVDELTRLDARRLTALDAALLGDNTRGIIFVADQSADALQVRLLSETPRFSSQIEVEALVTDRGYSESYSIKCVPESNEIDRLLVHFSGDRTEEFRWGCEPDEPSRVTARRLTDVELRSQNLPVTGETWQVDLPRPRGNPFVLRRVRELPRLDRLTVSLASTPHAVTQRGSVVVRSTAVELPTVNRGRLKTLPAEPAAMDSIQPALGRLAYDPSDDALSDQDSSLELVRAAVNTRPLPAWVWRWQLDAWYSSAGMTDYVARMAIENTGRSGVRVNFASIRQAPLVRLDGVVSTDAAFDSATQALQVSLPSGRRFTNLEIEWSEAGPGLDSISNRQLKYPTVDLPVLARCSTVWLPPDYDLADTAGVLRSSRMSPHAWTQRLFGPLGRNPGEATFEPWSRRDWSQLNEAATVDPYLQCATEFTRLLQARTARIDDSTNAEASKSGLSTLDRFSNLSSGASVESVSVAIPRVKHDLPNAAHQNRARDTWGERLYISWLEAANLQPDLRIPLFVHVSGLERYGIRSDAAAVPLTRKADEFGQALVVLVHPRGLLLTSRQIANEFLPTEPHNAAARVVTPGPMAEAFEAGALERLLGPVSSIETWLNLPPANRAAWDVQQPATSGVVFSSSWRAYQLETPADGLLPLRVVRPRSIQALGCVVFLAGVLLMWRGPRIPPLIKVTLWGSLAVAALLLPVSLAPLAAGGFAGMIVGQLCRWLVPARLSTKRPPSDDDALAKHAAGQSTNPPLGDLKSAVAHRVTAILVATGGLLIGATAWAQPPDGSVEPSDKVDRLPTAIYDVLVPVDDQQRPTGDVVYLPEKFYLELMRRTDAIDARGSENWMLLSANYVGALAGNSQAGDRLLDWTATFELETFAKRAIVELPFGNDGMRMIPDGTTIDDKPTSVNWDADRKVSTLEVADVGRHRLTIAFRPIGVAAGSRGNIDFSIPPCPVTQVEIALPAEGAIGTIVARGSVDADAKSRSLRAALGSVTRLVYQVDDPDSVSIQKPTFEVEDLQWLRIQPGSRTLDAKFRITVQRGQLKQLALLVDPRLQLAPLPFNAPIRRRNGSTHHAKAGQAGPLLLEFSQPVTDRATIELSFVLSDSTSAAQFRWPRLEVQHAQVSRRLIAANVDSWFDFAPPPLAMLKAIAPIEFSTAWGRADAPPAVSFTRANTDGPIEWSFLPPVVWVAAEDTTTYALGSKDVEFVWSCDVAVNGGNRLQFRAKAPAAAEISALEVRDAAGLRPARWSRSDRGVSIFLESPISGQLRIIARGRMPAATPDNVTLPELRLDDSETRSSTALVLRRSGVLATVVGQGVNVNLSPRDTVALFDLSQQQKWSVSSPSEPLAIVAAFSTKPAEGRAPVEQPGNRQIRVKLARNRPLVQGHQVTVIGRAADTWSATVHLDLNISDGVLDQIRLIVPPTWQGPYEVYPPVETQLIEVPLENRSQLILKPKEPLHGAVRFRIHSPMAIVVGQRLRVPDIEMSQGQQLRRFEVLPTRFELQQLDWDLAGLSPAPLPAGLAFVMNDSTPSRSFAVTGPQAHVELRSIEKLADSPQIRLADIVVSWNSDGSCYGSATFDLESAGTPSCLLAMPAGAELIAVSINGRVQLPAKVAENRWRLQLETGSLPQRIEVIFCGSIVKDLGYAAAALEAPRLFQLPVERTLWTVSGPAWAGAVTIDQGERIAPLRYEMERLESMAALLESASAPLADLPTDDVQRWYEPWARRLLSLRSAIDWQGELSHNLEASRQAAAKVNLIDQEQTRLARRLATIDLVNRLAGRRGAVDGVSELARVASGRWSEPAHAMTVGETSTLSVRYEARQPGDMQLRVVQAMSAASVLLGLAWVVTSTNLLLEVKRWPRLGLAAGGLIWWLWMWPSWFGWIIVMASLLIGRLGWSRQLRRWLQGKALSTK